MAPDAGEIAPRLVLAELQQVRTLADPLRMRIVEVLRREAATAKQVALALGERPSRLYHHVAALERAGLVRVVGTRPVRGAVEKYYRPVARQFVVDRALFAPARGGRRSAALGAVEAMTADILGTAMAEVRDGLLAGTLPLEDADRVEIARVPVRAGDARIVALMGALRDLVRDAAAADGTASDADAQEYRLTVAFYPLAARPAAPADPARR
jgi:DNA-binding transcriptional ArsR family regulator